MMNSPIKKTRDNGRERLISSALTLFCDKGFHAVSVREICDHASANPSLISFHFGGKEGLLETLFESIDPAQFSHITDTLTEASDGEALKEKLTDFFRRYVKFYLNNSEIVALYFDELERQHAYAVELLPKTFGSLFVSLVNFLETAQKKHIIHSGTDTKVLAYSMISPIGSTMRSKRSTPQFSQFTVEDPIFMEKLIKQVVDSVKLV
jgi:AcrR family transcriptional regulator